MESQISSERDLATNEGISLPATCVKPFPGSPSSDQVQIAAEYPVSLKSTCLEKPAYRVSVKSTSLEKLESPRSLKSASLEKLDYPASVKLSSPEHQECPASLKSTSLEKLESQVTLKLSRLELPESPVTLQLTNLEKLPPYEHPHVVRNSPRMILPARHRKGASATVLGAASAAFPSLSVIGKALTGGEGDLDDPVVWPLVRLLRSTAMATLEVPSEAEVPGKEKKKGKKMIRLSRKSLKKSLQTKGKKKKMDSCVIHAQSPSVL